jgi:hypothetical protein
MCPADLPELHRPETELRATIRNEHAERADELLEFLSRSVGDQSVQPVAFRNQPVASAYFARARFTSTAASLCAGASITATRPSTLLSAPSEIGIPSTSPTHETASRRLMW